MDETDPRRDEVDSSDLGYRDDLEEEAYEHAAEDKPDRGAPDEDEPGDASDDD
jgi:hypothetical protein